MSEKFTQDDLAQRAVDKKAQLNAIYGIVPPSVDTGGLTDAELRASPVGVSLDESSLPVAITLGSEVPVFTLASDKTLQSAPISVNTGGNNVIVAAVPDQRIKITSFSIQVTGTVNVKLKDGSTDMTGPWNFQAREGIAMSTGAPGFLLATAAGNDLILHLSTAVSVVGFVTYFTNDAT